MATPAARSSRWPTTHWWRSLLHCYTESSTTTMPTMRSLETLSGVARMSWAPGEKIWMSTVLSRRLQKMLQIFPIVGFLCRTVVFLSRNVLIFPVCHYLSLSSCLMTFKINYSHPEVSYITKAKAVWTGVARFRPLSQFSWHCLHPFYAGAPLHNYPVPPPFSPPFPKCFYWKASGQGHREKLWGYSPSSHYHGDAKTVFDSQAKH